jgi:signal transduction histidine kinase/DNA-binding LacI/PurR family transcriptional regulator
MTQPPRPPNERKTIAVLGAQVSRVWNAEFMAGVLDAAKARDVNVVYFVGGKPIAFPAPNKKEASRSYGLYDLVQPAQFDGALLSADLGHGTSPKELEEFCRAFATLPVVSFAIPAEGIPSFLADNEGGMRALIRHLIEEHGYKRIAFIRGPQGQVEAEQRFNAYREELKAHHIRFDESLILDGDYTPESGRAAVRAVLDAHGSRLQAIAASNDRMAFGALEVLQQRGIHVPDGIALTGFDDVSEAQSIGVPLTTVHQSFYEIGRQAFEALLKRINGEYVQAVNVLPADLVVRWSCGCLPESIQRAVVLPREVAHTGRLENKRDAAIRALFGAAGIPENDPFKDRFVDVFGRAWDVFLASLRENDKSDAFLKMIQTSMETLQQNGHDFTDWHNFISTFRKYALGGITSNTAMLRAENLFQQARMLVGELSQRAQAYRRLLLERQEEALNNFSFSMAPVMRLEELSDAIKRQFPNLGLERWHVMYQSDINAPGSVSLLESYRLLLRYDRGKFDISQGHPSLATGRLVPRGELAEDHRCDAVVMPLSLASNRFGFMWAEIGPRDWDVYVRVKNLVSSALLRVMLARQREQAQKEVERLLGEARERASELAKARDAAEKAAAQNAKLFAAEQERRRSAEALARSSRRLSSLSTVEKLPQHIFEQLRQVLPHDRGILFIEDVNGAPQIRAHQGMPAGAKMEEFQLRVKGADFYRAVARKGETLIVNDVNTIEGWSQPAWLAADRAWLGAPLYSKGNAIGVLALSRASQTFSEYDALLATTFAMQATVALENARLYDEVTGINQMMERMVAERVKELNNAYNTLAQHDKNKSAFIKVAAHELRTPLTVIKGYLGMLKGDRAIQANPMLVQALDGVAQGTNRLHQIVNSMLDAARLESQVFNPHLESVSLGLILRLIHKDYADDLSARSLTFTLDDAIKDIPPLWADPDLLKKALDHVIVNAIKFTPDGGAITVAARVVEDAKQGGMAELCVKDTGIGIAPEHHKIIFEKLYQLGTVDLHSSSRTNFKGGGAGLGLAVASGIVKAFKGSIWVESEGCDEEKLPGSSFFIRLPLAKE